MVSKLRLSRDQLASFLKDHEQIKQFERLFGAVDDMANDDSTEVDVSTAIAAVNDLAARLSALLDTLDMEPPAAPVVAQDDVEPPVQHNNSVVTDYIDLPVNGPHVTQARRIQWNEDDGTIDVGLNDEVTLQVGQEIHYFAKNDSGGTIDNGTPVMFTGTVGASGKLKFGKAIADGSIPSSYMMGVATESIASNVFGYVTSFGLVRGFDTTGTPYGEVWADGDLLYFSDVTPGNWTNVQPVAPSIGIPVAVVIHAASGGSGSIFVRMELSHSLDSLQDVALAAPATGDLLTYNGTVWVNTGAITSDLTNNTGRLIDSITTLTNGAGAMVGTLNNAPAVGNPTKWVAIDDNGTTRYIPAW